MFNGQRYRAHNAVRRSARDLFFRSSREKPAGRTSTGRYSTFAARAIRRRQSEKLASQWIHANVATGLQSRTAFCSDRDDSISGASDPKFSKVFADRFDVRIQFAEFTLDLDTRQLLQRGTGEIRLSPKAFDLLAALIEQRPKVMDKADLHTRSGELEAASLAAAEVRLIAEGLRCQPLLRRAVPMLTRKPERTSNATAG